MSMGQLPALLTVPEVAERLRVTDETIHRWARRGALECVFLPTGLKRFRRDYIESIERGEIDMPAPVADDEPVEGAA